MSPDEDEVAEEDMPSLRAKALSCWNGLSNVASLIAMGFEALRSWLNPGVVCGPVDGVLVKGDMLLKVCCGTTGRSTTQLTKVS